MPRSQHVFVPFRERQQLQELDLHKFNSCFNGDRSCDVLEGHLPYHGNKAFETRFGDLGDYTSRH